VHGWKLIDDWTVQPQQPLSQPALLGKAGAARRPLLEIATGKYNFSVVPNRTYPIRIEILCRGAPVLPPPSCSSCSS